MSIDTRIKFLRDGSSYRFFTARCSHAARSTRAPVNGSGPASFISHVFFDTISRSHHHKKTTLIHTFLSQHRSSSASDLLISIFRGKSLTLTVYRWFLDVVVVWNSPKLMCGAWTEKVYGIPNAEVGLTRKRIMTTRPPLPPFSRETAIQKVRLAEDGWDSRDPDKRANSYPSGPISAWQDQSRRKSPYLLSNN